MGTPIDQLRQTIIANDTHKGNMWHDGLPCAKFTKDIDNSQWIQLGLIFGLLGVKHAVMVDMLFICLIGFRSIRLVLSVIAHASAKFNKHSNCSVS